MVNDYEEFTLCIGEINLTVCLRISNSQMVGDNCFLYSYDADIVQGKFKEGSRVCLLVRSIQAPLGLIETYYSASGGGTRP